MSSGDQKALRLADECANFDASIYRDVAHANAGMLAKLQDAADEIRRLVAEREADRAVMREALEALETSEDDRAVLTELFLWLGSFIATAPCVTNTMHKVANTMAEVHNKLAKRDYKTAISSLKARTQ